MRSDIVPGKTFPDYQLPDHTGTLRKLSELQGDDPLIVTLSRGHYCPKEHQQHLELASFYPKIAVGYTPPTTITHYRSSARPSEPSGRFCPILNERCRGTSTSRSTPILSTIR
jgi:hypothetical protein